MILNFPSLFVPLNRPFLTLHRSIVALTAPTMRRISRFLIDAPKNAKRAWKDTKTTPFSVRKLFLLLIEKYLFSGVIIPKYNSYNRPVVYVWYISVVEAVPINHAVCILFFRRLIPCMNLPITHNEGSCLLASLQSRSGNKCVLRYCSSLVGEPAIHFHGRERKTV